MNNVTESTLDPINSSSLFETTSSEELWAKGKIETESDASVQPNDPFNFSTGSPLSQSPQSEQVTLTDAIHSGLSSNLQHEKSCCCSSCLFPAFDREIQGNSVDSLDLKGLTISAFDPSQVFALNSLSSAQHTIYLDFDGHTTSGTYWNYYYSGNQDFITPAYDFDGNSSSFSNAELERIYDIWQRVSEDFSPFNVNVTTQAPANLGDLSNSGGGDSRWGIRVVVGGSSDDWFQRSAGGVAFLNSFTWGSDTPAFVFEDQLANGNEKYTADAITHEVGHTLGLNHDGRISPAESYYQGHGSGETGWASAMGVGYYKNLVQWSKGEYGSANNQEDDLQIITTTNGFGYRADDAGNTIGTANNLNVAGTSVWGKGIIERNTDVDFYQFTTGAGSINLNVTPFNRGPNLDILAELYNSTGTLIASANPSELLSASITKTVIAGTYYLKIDGVGKGDPLTTGYSDYGSLGQYDINGTIVQPPTVTPSTISISDPATVIEGLDTEVVFTVTLSQASASPIAVDYSTVNQTAKAGQDYDTQTGTLIFAPNQTQATISVSVKDDDLSEVDETFKLTLSNPVNATLAQSTAVATISDTLVASTNTVLPALVENLLLSGNGTINGTGNDNNNLLTGNSGANRLNGGVGSDILVGNEGADRFIFRFGESSIAAHDQIKDFAIGVDKIDLLTRGGASFSRPPRLTRASDSMVSTLLDLVTEVFTDADGATAGNQALGAKSAALVQVSSGAIAGTYMVINDATSALEVQYDTVIDITGYTGSLPDFGTISPSLFFI